MKRKEASEQYEKTNFASFVNFTPSSLAVNVNGANVINQNFTDSTIVPVGTAGTVINGSGSFNAQ